jgi:pimeloyl-ACP methyl ester carboxylesterase
LHVVEEGPKDGTPVVLLHGFPEFWYSWRHQLPALAAAGFRAIAPDLRGYNLSDKPKGLRNYTTEQLVGDVVGLIRACGHERAHVVGHDWGGALAYQFAARHPEMMRRLVIMNAPHPRLLLRRLRRSFTQLRRSWYMFFFQLPKLPERMILRDDFMPRVLRGMATHKESFDDDVLARFTEAIRQPGAATATINYYRAAMRRPSRGSSMIDCPTLVLWGDRDHALGVELLEGLDTFVPHLEVRHVPDASHWIQNDCPEIVNRELISFLHAA